MSKLLEQAIEVTRNLAPAIQDDVARLIFALTGQEQPAIEMTDDEAASFDESFAQAERGEFAEDAHIRSLWAKHGL